MATDDWLQNAILYEDNHLIVVNKPSGLLAQGDATGDDPLGQYIKTYLKTKYKKPGNVFLGVAHRLDRPVSGVVVFARPSKALARLNEGFKQKSIEKTYWAVVGNYPPAEQGTLTNYLLKHEPTNKSRVVAAQTPGAKLAQLHYKLLAASERYFLLEVKPLTGRHHQIRVQLAQMGCPIRGDLKYGYPRSNAIGSIHLHAQRIKLVHPVQGTQLLIEAPLPANDAVWAAFSNIAV